MLFHYERIIHHMDKFNLYRLKSSTGSADGEVMKLQSTLNQKKYTDNNSKPLRVDGIYGDKTNAAFEKMLEKETAFSTDFVDSLYNAKPKTKLNTVPKKEKVPSVKMPTFSGTLSGLPAVKLPTISPNLNYPYPSKRSKIYNHDDNANPSEIVESDMEKASKDLQSRINTISDKYKKKMNSNSFGDIISKIYTERHNSTPNQDAKIIPPLATSYNKPILKNNEKDFPNTSEPSNLIFTDKNEETFLHYSQLSSKGSSKKNNNPTNRLSPEEFNRLSDAEKIKEINRVNKWSAPAPHTTDKTILSARSFASDDVLKKLSTDNSFSTLGFGYYTGFDKLEGDANKIYSSKPLKKFAADTGLWIMDTLSSYVSSTSNTTPYPPLNLLIAGIISLFDTGPSFSYLDTNPLLELNSKERSKIAEYELIKNSEYKYFMSNATESKRNAFIKLLKEQIYKIETSPYQKYSSPTENKKYNNEIINHLKRVLHMNVYHKSTQKQLDSDLEKIGKGINVVINPVHHNK